MKDQILKLAGVKSEKEFYKKYPSEEAFMKDHGKEFKKVKLGNAIPKNQNAKFTIPNARDIARANMPASESTSRTIKTSTGPVNTATVGQSKENVAASTKNMGKAMRKETDRRMAKKAKAKEARDSEKYNTSFTLPNGETKDYNDMSFAEKAYVAGEATGDMFRNDALDESWIGSELQDLNPLNWFSGMGENLGKSLYEAEQSGSMAPIEGAILDPVMGGAIAGLFSPGKTAMQTLKSKLDPLTPAKEIGKLLLDEEGQMFGKKLGKYASKKASKALGKDIVEEVKTPSLAPSNIAGDNYSPNNALVTQIFNPNSTLATKTFKQGGQLHRLQQLTDFGNPPVAQVGTYIGGGQASNPDLINFSDYKDKYDYAVTGMTDEMRRKQAQAAQAQAAQSSQKDSGGGMGNMLGGLKEIFSKAGGSEGGAEGLSSLLGSMARNGKRVPKYQFSGQGIPLNANPSGGFNWTDPGAGGITGNAQPVGGMTNPNLNPPALDMGNLASGGVGTFEEQMKATNKIMGKKNNTFSDFVGKYGGPAGKVIQGLKALDQEKEQRKRAEATAKISDLTLQAANTRPEQMKRRYVRPEDAFTQPNQLSPSYGVGTNYLAKDGTVVMKIGGNLTEIQNTYAPNNLYNDLGYEPLDESNTMKQYRAGGFIHSFQGGGSTPWAAIGGMGEQLGNAATGDNAGGNIGGTIGGSVGEVAGNLILPGIGGAAGKAIGQTLGAVTGGLLDKNAKRIEAANKRTAKNVEQAAMTSALQAANAQNSAYVRNGGNIPTAQTGNETSGGCPPGYAWEPSPDGEGGQCVKLPQDYTPNQTSSGNIGGDIPSMSSYNNYQEGKPVGFGFNVNDSDTKSTYNIGGGYTGRIENGKLVNSGYNLSVGLPRLFGRDKGISVTGDYGAGNLNVGANTKFPFLKGTLGIKGGYSQNFNREEQPSSDNRFMYEAPSNSTRSNLNAGVEWTGKIGKTNVKLSGNYGTPRREEGGWVSHDWQPQVIATFGEHSMEDLLRRDPMMDTLRTGGHITQNNMFPTDQYALGGELKTTWGGYAEPISHNPYMPGSGETVMFRGKSHAEGDGKGHTGIGVKYGEGGKLMDYAEFGSRDADADVEVERGEPATEMIDGQTGEKNMVVFGNLMINGGSAAHIGDTSAKGKKFKNYVADLGKIEAKQNKIVDKASTELDDLNVYTPFDKLKMDSLQAMSMGANMKLKDIAVKKSNAAAVQNAINDTAAEHGIDADHLSKGKIKIDKEAMKEQARFGKEIFKAQDGTNLPAISKKDYDYLKSLYDEAQKQGKGDKVLKFQKEYHRLVPEYAKAVISEYPTTTHGGKHKPKFTNKELASNEDAIFGKRTKRYMAKLDNANKEDYDVEIPLVDLSGPWDEEDDSSSTEKTTTDKTTLKTVEPNKTPWWAPYANQAIDYLRPTDQEPFDYTQVYPEMAALATNQVAPVQVQLYNPDLGTPIDISLQDQMNANQADFNAIQRQVGYNPAALSVLASQKYKANSSVLGEQFRLNQAEKQRVYEGNRSTLNQAQLQNLGLLDQQMTRQETAKSKTKEQALEAMKSISDKIAKNKLENKTLGIYENLYNYRYDKSGRAVNMNPLAFFDVAADPAKASSASAPEGYEYETILKKKKKKDEDTGRNGKIVKAIKNL